MSPVWWTRLSRKDQLKYLKAHPRSKLKPKRAPVKRGKKNTKKVVRKKKSAGIPQEELRKAGEEAPQKEEKSARLLTEKEVSDKGKAAIDSYVKEAEKYIPVRVPLKGADKKATLELVGKHQDEVHSLLNNKLESERRNAAKTVDDMKPKELSKLGLMIKRGVEKESGKDLLAAAGIFLAKAGIVTVGLGLATAVGITPAVAMIGLFNYRHTINNYIDGPLRRTVTDFVTGMYEGMQEALDDHTNVRKNLVANEPDTVLKNDKEEATVESASVPSHISDVVKAFSALCKKDFYGRYQNCARAKLVWMKANSLLNLLYDIEFDLRRLNNLSTRFRIEKEMQHLGKSVIRQRELSRIREQILEQIALLAATQVVDTNVQATTQFANLLLGRNSALTSGDVVRTYILDKGQLTLCWLIKAENVRATLFLMPRVYVYIACDGPFRVAVSMNNMTTPNSMQKYDAKLRPATILSEYGLQ